MAGKTLVERYVEDPTHMRLFQQERAIYEVTELLEATMAELSVSRADLAQRLGKTKGWVTQLLDGEANKTIRTVADAFAVLGREYHATQRPIQIGTRSPIVTSVCMTPVSGTSERNINPAVPTIMQFPQISRSPSTPQLTALVAAE